MFEKIDVEALKFSLNSCKESINHSITSDYSKSILNSNIWINNSKRKLSTALSSLNDVYIELENKIDKYIEVVGLIEKYKAYESSNSQLSADNKELEKKKYYDEWYSEEYIDENGEKKTKSWYETKEDYNVTNKIKENDETIKDNNTQMDSLKKKIFDSL